MEYFRIAAAFAGLLANSIWDIRKKNISLTVTAFMGIMGIGIRIALQDIQFTDTVLSLMPGVLSLLFALVSRERVGYGDGLLLLAVGCCLKGQEMIALWMLALGLAGLWALVLCICFHKGKKYEIPFVPFVFAGFLVGRCLI